MLSNSVTIDIKSIKDSPVYGKDFKMIKITKAIVTKKGTQSGKPTVDLQCVDNYGNKYLIFATGKIIQMIGQFVAKENMQ